MLSMVSGGRGFAANPLDGLTFFLEPVRPLAATISSTPRGSRSAVRAHLVRDRRRAARLLRAAVVRRAGPRSQPLSRYGIRADGDRGVRRASRPTQRAAREQRAPGRSPTGSATALAGRRRRARAADARDRRVHAGQGHLLPAPGLLVRTPTAALEQSAAGGFLDPIQGTLLLTAIGIAIAAPARGRVALWLVEYGRPAGLARAVESAVEIDRRRAERPARALRARPVRPGLPRLPLPDRRRTESVYGRSFFAAGSRWRCSRCRSSSAPRARRCRLCPLALREALLCARQDARDDHPPRAAAVDPARHRNRRRCSAWGGSSATRRSSRSCSAGLRTEPAAASRASACCAGRARPSRATSTSTRPLVKATPRRRPTRRLRAAAYGARLERHRDLADTALARGELPQKRWTDVWRLQWIR